MHIEYLKVFYEVASARSISKVANSSHISQPALSQQIQRLEDSVGLKLLERSNKGVELTDAGKIVEKYAIHMIKAYDNMIEDLNDLRSNKTTIRIDACPIMGTYALPCTIYKVSEKFPTYKFNLTSNLSDEVEQNVLNDISDVGFILGKPADPGLCYSKVVTDRLIAVVSQDFDIRQELYSKDLIKHPQIFLMEKFHIQKSIISHFSRLGYSMEDLNVLFYMDSIESIKSTIVKGYGISILPYISVKKELYTKQLKVLNVQDMDLEYDIYIIYKKDKDMYKSTRELIQYLRKVGEKSFC